MTDALVSLHLDCLVQQIRRCGFDAATIQARLEYVGRVRDALRSGRLDDDEPHDPHDPPVPERLRTYVGVMQWIDRQIRDLDRECRRSIVTAAKALYVPR